jgi:hypothetical protein
MPSRASVINVDWANVALTAGAPKERREMPSSSGHRASRRERQSSGSSAVSRHVDECSSAVESVNATVEAYNEAAFRYFLQVEEKRFHRSNRRFALLLLDLRSGSGNVEPFDPALSKKLFTALGTCVRETDFLGWYCQGRVIGVACTQLDDTQGSTISEVVSDRFQKAMRGALPERIGSRVHMRSYFLPSNEADRS